MNADKPKKNKILINFEEYMRAVSSILLKIIVSMKIIQKINKKFTIFELKQR